MEPKSSHRSAHCEFSIIAVAPMKGNHLEHSVLNNLKLAQARPAPKVPGVRIEGAGKIGVSLHAPSTVVSAFLERYFLSSARLLAELHDATVAIDSVLGEGAVFRISFPEARVVESRNV